MKKAFTIMELLVAVGLLAVVLAAVGIVFNYSINAQRTAASTAEIMHTLRAITDQINIDFTGLQKDGYLVLWSDDSNSAVYFFSTGDFQSWYDSSIKSNTARIYLGPAADDPNNLALDMRLLTPGYIPTPGSKLDYNDVSFAQCKADINNLEDPYTVLSTDRPGINMAYDPNDARRLLAQKVGSFKIQWTYGWTRSNEPNRIVWWGLDDVGDPNALRDETSLIKEPNGVAINSVEILLIANAINEVKGPPYTVWWDSTNQQYWPKALKFTFTLYDSRGLFKNGRKFEHIVYIGN
jgi:type II secretory pathway pseudopilin PulG